jgi:hypothetical protein
MLRVIQNADGRLEVFGVSFDERIWHTWQTAPNNGWVGGWAELYSPADRLRDLRVARNLDGRLEVFGISSDERIWHTWQTAPSNGWVGGWAELYSPADRLRMLDIGQNADGRLEIFGVSSDDRIWHTWQTAPSNGWIGGWAELYSPVDRLRTLKVIRNQDGRLEVFGVSSDDRIWHTWQVAPSNGWNGGWAELFSPADRLRSLDVGRNADGRLEVFGVSSDDRIWHTWQTAPSNGWNGQWAELYSPADRLRELRVSRNQDGRLEIFGVAPDDSIWHTWQVAPSNGWVGGWVELGTQIRILIKVITTPNVAIATMLANMRAVFATAGIRVSEGPRENLTVVPTPGAPAQTAFNVGPCNLGQALTADQTRLFANRNNAGANDIVLYMVTTVNSAVGPLNGCATSTGLPGAVISQGASQWTMAHEVGHVLGLTHLTTENTGCPAVNPACCSTPNFGRLMTGCGTLNITSTPTLVQAEINTMQASARIRRDRLRALEAVQNAEGRLEVFGVSSDDRIWHTWQTSPNNGWNEGG